jgi:hypothetical protein
MRGWLPWRSAAPDGSELFPGHHFGWMHTRMSRYWSLHHFVLNLESSARIHLACNAAAVWVRYDVLF